MFWNQMISKSLRQTISGRLSLWYFVSIGSILAIFLTLILIIFWYTLKDQVDHHVHIAVSEAVQIVEKFQGEERNQLLQQLVGERGMTIILLSSDGTPLLETNSPDIARATEHRLQTIMANVISDSNSPVHFDEHKMRFAAMKVDLESQSGILAVGYSTEIFYQTFSKILMVVAAMIGLLVLPLTLWAYRYLKFQLRPLENIAEQAQQLGNPANLSRRIKLQTNSQELAIIQTAINNMLSRLEKSFKKEKQFFGDTAHTLKTPLAAIRSQIENSQLSSPFKQSILNSLDRAIQTVEDLLLLAQIDLWISSPTKFSLSQMMEDLVELTINLGMEKNLKVSSQIQPDVEVTLDKNMLERALINLLHNSVIYNRPAGKIFIELTKYKHKLMVRIKDTGIGIASHEQTKVFQRFYRASNTNHPGSGLGLAISRQIISALGGEIRLTSEVDQGTEITIVLPFHISS